MNNSEQSAFPLGMDILMECGEKPSPFGLSKREYYAGLAMQGMLAQSIDKQQGVQPYYDMGYVALCQRAVEIADCLLAELEKQKP